MADESNVTFVLFWFEDGQWWEQDQFDGPKRPIRDPKVGELMDTFGNLMLEVLGSYNGGDTSYFHFDNSGKPSLNPLPNASGGELWNAGVYSGLLPANATKNSDVSDLHTRYRDELISNSVKMIGIVESADSIRGFCEDPERRKVEKRAARDRFGKQIYLGCVQRRAPALERWEFASLLSRTAHGAGDASGT